MSDSTPDDAKRHASGQHQYYMGLLYDDTKAIRDTEESLCAEYAAWCTAQNLPWVDAQELMHSELTPSQRLWLTEFILRWEETVK